MRRPWGGYEGDFERAFKVGIGVPGGTGTPSEVHDPRIDQLLRKNLGHQLESERREVNSV